MKSRGILSAGLFAASLLAMAAIAYPAPPQSPARRQDPPAASANANLNASGRNTAVSGDTFTLDVQKAGTIQTMQFRTDAKTQIRGKLEVGMIASVQYHLNTAGSNIASHVVVESKG